MFLPQKEVHMFFFSKQNKFFKVFLFTVTLLFFVGVSSLWAAGKKRPIYNEALNFKVTWKGITIGSVDMKSKTISGNRLTVLAKVASFKAIQGIYYVGGSFGSIWNYSTQLPIYAYEEMYQGDTYQKRSYRFSKSGNVKIRKKEIRFAEHGYPHTGTYKSDTDESYEQNSPNFQDLLGSFYFVRSTGEVPHVGETRKVLILPAGSEKYLLLEVLEQKKVKVAALGSESEKEVFHVRTALRNKGEVDELDEKGGDLFFNTTSEFHMFITADEDFIPVLMWTSLPVIGRVYLRLDAYKQL